MVINKDTLLAEVNEAQQKLVEVRRHLHANPELSFHEKNTSAFIARELDTLGIPFTEGIGGYGIVANIGKSTGKLVALRGDMDALPINEENEVPYASKNPGVMHACGHDVHTTCLLGAAMVLKKYEASLPGSVRLLFQPAEERIPGGASLMIADGALRNPDVNLIFGQHVYPDMEVGHVGFRPGIYMASADEIYLTVNGKGGHAALPQKFNDPVLAASHIIIALQQIVSRRSDPTLPSVLSIGKVIANGATNVIPDKVMMEGTFRTLDEQWRERAHEEIRRVVHHTAAAMGVTSDLEIRKGYPCLTNNPELAIWSMQQAESLFGESRVHELPIRMTAEDFAYFAQAVPACFFRLGTSNTAKGIGAPLHTSKFDIDEAALQTGTALMAWLAVKALEENYSPV
jgi:amidohydrolase